MGTFIYRKTDGTEIVLKENVSENEEFLFGSDYIARKLWSREDIRMCLQNEGFTGTDEQVSDVLKYGVDSLNDCTDEDWETIIMAIHEVMSVKQMKGGTKC